MFRSIIPVLFLQTMLVLLAMFEPIAAFAKDLELEAKCPSTVSVSQDQKLYVDVIITNKSPLPITGKNTLVVSLAGTKLTSLAILGPFTRTIELNIPGLSSQTFKVLVTTLEDSLANKIAVVGIGIKTGDHIDNVDKCLLKVVP